MNCDLGWKSCDSFGWQKYNFLTATKNSGWHRANLLSHVLLPLSNSNIHAMTWLQPPWSVAVTRGKIAAEFRNHRFLQNDKNNISSILSNTFCQYNSAATTFCIILTEVKLNILWTTKETKVNRSMQVNLDLDLIIGALHKSV